MCELYIDEKKKLVAAMRLHPEISPQSWALIKI